MLATTLVGMLASGAIFRAAAGNAGLLVALGLVITCVAISLLSFVALRRVVAVGVRAVVVPPERNRSATGR